MSRATRREFLWKTAAASGMLAAHQLCAAAPKSPTTQDSVVTKSLTTHCPLIVVSEHVSSDVNPRGSSWGYIREILDHGGLFFQLVSPDELLSLRCDTSPIVLLAGELTLTEPQQQLLMTLVRNGGTLIGIGGTSGLDAVFGIRSKKPLAEGWMQVEAKEHAITANLRSSLHVFGGFAAIAETAVPLARLEVGRQGAQGNAILENSFGQGRAILLAPDLIFSIVHMQQGVPVLQDGQPAPDDSAALDDGELKAEDGLVLDWERDRTPLPPDDVPVFLEPITDELRTIILRSVFHAARQMKVALPLLWYWPRSLPAVGHISHDTDGHDPDKAVALLEVMNRVQVKSTWCTLYPGGYPRAFYDTLKAQDFEIALHYDARTGGPETSWSKENFLLQHRWLLEAAGLDTIVSNKNHYTRWESRLDFLRWCEDVGIVADQTRGPSKHGTIGFPVGGSHPYFAWDDEADVPRLMNVMEINMLTQDLVVVCPAEYGQQLMDSVLRQHGVAHFLFHPAHIQKPGVADALSQLVNYGRQQGVEWWTSQQIYDWQRQRRHVDLQHRGDGVLAVQTAQPVKQATLLFLRVDEQPTSIQLDQQTMETRPHDCHGFMFDGITADLADGTRLKIG